MERIVAVVVTHNRLSLLQETVGALHQQERRPDRIIVVNNGSTDGTREWLDGQPGLIALHQENAGGSAGFYTGIKAAAGQKADWVWLMDDDTICHPDTLYKLREKIQLINEPIGFLSSKCLWTDGAPHRMNIPAILPHFNRTRAFNQYDAQGLLLTETSSFVSLLVNMTAVKQVGLPYRDFFIWGDDQEYTRRITSAGFLGLYVIDSTVTHKTPINHFPEFYHDPPETLWKHRYGFRNEFFMVKKRKGLFYFLGWAPIKLAYTSAKLIASRKDHRLRFIAALHQAAWRALLFNPSIERL